MEITWRLHMEYSIHGMASRLSVAGARYEDMYDLSSDGCRRGRLPPFRLTFEAQANLGTWRMDDLSSDGCR
jgi:hypothetical protein